LLAVSEDNAAVTLNYVFACIFLSNDFALTYWILFYTLLVLVLIASVIFTLDPVKFERHQVACLLDTSNSCSFCNILNVPEDEKCPEWEQQEVESILRTLMKQSACLACLLLIYAIEGFRFGFVLRRHISHYQIDYV